MTTKDSSYTDQIHEYGLDLKHREIYLFGREDYISVYEGEEPGVDFAMANRFIKNLHILQNESSQPITIFLKSCGGDWLEGISIYQAIKYSPNYITILNYTSARSMSSIIFLAGDRRIMMPYSTFMFHKGTEGFEGTVTQFYTEYEQLRIADRQMLEIYVEALQGSNRFKGEKTSKIKKWLVDRMKAKEEVYLSAEEAVELNFAHEIFQDWEKVKTT